MKVQFWGTRGSIAKAGPSTLRYGGNTSCVELRSAAGTLAMIDCGTGAHGLGHALLEESPDGPVSGHILITHTHWDHIQGFPFFAPLFRPNSTWHVYGPRGFGTSLRDTLSGQMQYAYFPVNLDQLAANVHYHDLMEGEFEVGDLRVTAHYLNHPALTLGYRIEADDAVVVYASDHEPHSHALAEGGAPGDSREDAAHVAFLSGADLVIHDAQYRANEYPKKVGWGHSTVEYAVDCTIAAGAKMLALYHHDPLRDDSGVDENLAMARARVEAAGANLNVCAATEGEALSVAGTVPRNMRAVPTERDAKVVPTEHPEARGVLVVGCSEATGKRIAEAAGADAIEVRRADGTQSALAMVTEHRPAVIFAGAPLADGTAFDLCRAVRDLNDGYGQAAVFIAVIRSDSGEARRAGNLAGVTDWLAGPVTPQYVRTRLRAWLLRQSCRWQAAPLPPDEEERLGALHATALLDSEPEARFDAYARLAAVSLGVPIALISLVDARRQWFKAKHGVDVAEMPRDRAFCAHTILDVDVMQVPDATEDDRFADNPLVTGDPRVRFYAGVPLRSADGYNIGTLCVIDHRPRALHAQEVEKLRDLARRIEAELEET